jgi:spore germination cell wall hydrolase CwlJ-like protein
MKKILIISITLISFLFLSSFTYENFLIQNSMTTIIEMAQNAGISDNDPLIQRAKHLQEQAKEQYRRDLEIIATVVYNEAGYGCSDRHMELVAAVIYNRLKSDMFPDTVYEIVVAPKQYHPLYAEENSFYHQLAKESDKWSQCLKIAERALRGDIDCPETVFFQANFPQGSADYEIHYTSYSITWFCYQ